MIALDAAQTRNFAAALATEPDRARCERLAFAIWSESRGYNYANGGLNTSKSPGVTPVIAVILRRSIALPNDGVRNNGRSTGILQQTSEEVGGGWGDMAGTMDPATSAGRFNARLAVTDEPIYEGWLYQPDGSRRKVKVTLSDPIAADVLRVQQPLADEAESDNYGPANVAIARELAARFAPATKPTITAASWLRLFAAVAAGK